MNLIQRTHQDQSANLFPDLSERLHGYNILFSEPTQISRMSKFVRISGVIHNWMNSDAAEIMVETQTDTDKLGGVLSLVSD